MKGLLKWDDRSCYYVQSNNSIEGFLRSIALASGNESCGPTAAVTILACMGYGIAIAAPGAYKPQPEQVLWDYLNDPLNYPKFKAARENLEPGTIPGNRVPQYYPVAVREVFDQACSFSMGISFDQVAASVGAGKGVQICLINPGHYLPVVAYDEQKQELVYHDPLPSRHPGGDGFKRSISKADFESNVKPFAITYE